MKELMEEYGRAVIAVVVAVIMFFIIFSGIKEGEAKGLTAVLAGKTLSESQDFSAYQDTGNSQVFMERKRPFIRFFMADVKTGQVYAPEDLFEAEDMEGNPAKLKILKIMDGKMQETEVTDNKMLFVRQGIYQVWVRAIDSYCCTTEHVFLVPVKRG